MAYSLWKPPVKIRILWKWTFARYSNFSSFTCIHTCLCVCVYRKCNNYYIKLLWNTSKSLFIWYIHGQRMWKWIQWLMT